jgi:hypothetical protein
MKYYKIVNPKGHQRIKYKEGRNIDPLPFNPSGNCSSGGIYFSREDILAFVHYGTDVYEVTPIGEIYENPGTPKKWKAHEVDLKYVGKVSDGETVQMLIAAGADVHAGHDRALCWAAKNGHTEIVKILLDAGADVHADHDYALCCADNNGHTKTVKVLLDAGADVHASRDVFMYYAALNRHTKTVRVRLDTGAGASM